VHIVLLVYGKYRLSWHYFVWCHLSGSHIANHLSRLYDFRWIEKYKMALDALIARIDRLKQ
jgi:hypothetical protein